MRPRRAFGRKCRKSRSSPSARNGLRRRQPPQGRRQAGPRRRHRERFPQCGQREACCRESAHRRFRGQTRCRYAALGRQMSSCPQEPQGESPESSRAKAQREAAHWEPFWRVLHVFRGKERVARYVWSFLIHPVQLASYIRLIVAREPALAGHVLARCTNT